VGENVGHNSNITVRLKRNICSDKLMELFTPVGSDIH